MKCKRCKKELDEKEYICKNCLTIIDLQKHEEQVDEKVKEIGVVQNVPKNNYIFCDKCGEYVEIGSSSCGRCGHILNEEMFEGDAARYREFAEEENVYKDNKALRILCYCLPLLGLILWLKYRRKEPMLASLCIEKWKDGLLFISGLYCIPRVIVIAIIYGTIAFFVGGF